MANTYTLTAKATIDLVDNNNNVLADIDYTYVFPTASSKTVQRGDLVATTGGDNITVVTTDVRGILYVKNEETTGSAVRISVGGTGIITLKPQEWFFAPIDSSNSHIVAVGVTADATISYLLFEE